jgi:hypothetical protein
MLELYYENWYCTRLHGVIPQETIPWRLQISRYIFIAGDVTAMSIVHMVYEPEKGLEGTVVTSFKILYRRLYGGRG